MANPPPQTRRALLAATGTTLVGVTGATAIAGASGAEGEESTVDVEQSTSSTSSPSVRVPSTSTNNGIVIQFRDCSRVRIFGNPFAADLVSVFGGYYDADGDWQDIVYDAEADLPMRIDLNEEFGEHAASDVVTGGVDVFEQDDDGPSQLHSAQPPEDWDCIDSLEQP
ncbi:hypothetical protein G6M89_19155 [Natronolimnobius sp. AArcel1]|uniref:hypothetical protein n=1 Tax=Natronolimnobius sp. AArcel1 TaxID=1679093 RepID=UPI0013EBF524|nr:hypothetical protein [Natronolimnobius sp. AArcel1]NGM71095.1 hypothetical protein [Natronolimnobius sp. AArcel1]